MGVFIPAAVTAGYHLTSALGFGVIDTDAGFGGVGRSISIDLGTDDGHHNAPPLTWQVTDPLINTHGRSVHVRVEWPPHCSVVPGDRAIGSALSSLSVLRPAQRSGARRAGYQVKHTGVTRGVMLLYALIGALFGR